MHPLYTGDMISSHKIYRLYLKRLADILISMLVLPLVVMIALPIAIAIKLEDGGTVFYVSKRYGKEMRPFWMYKFRSMKMNAEDIRNPDGSTYNSKNDSRQTMVGKILRKTSLDELPQFFNVFIGDMSLVGPRPSPMGNEATYTEFVKKKFAVRPGITGLNQATLRNKATLEERYENDVFYSENVSFSLDIDIILKTVVNVLKRENIYNK